LKTGWATGPGRSAAKGNSAGPGLASEHAGVADAAGEAVRVETLEEELRLLAAAADQVAEPCERDRALALAFLDYETLCLLLGPRTDRQTVA
jgi:hypothetical protein